MRRIIIRKKPRKYTIIDDEDYGYLNQWNWYFGGGDYTGSYVIRKSPEGTRYIHRELMHPKKGEYVDHINGNKLDNRKKNLRIVDGTQNLANMHKTRVGSSKYKGVQWRKDTKMWRVRVKVYGQEIHGGYYYDEKEAAKAYNRIAKDVFGQHSYLNKV